MQALQQFHSIWRVRKFIEAEREIEHSRRERNEQPEEPRQQVRVQRPDTGDLVDRLFYCPMQNPAERNSEAGKNGDAYGHGKIAH